MNSYKAPFAIHPGETLKDILSSLNMSQAQLASRVGMHVKTINEMTKGVNPITSDTSLKLSMVFGMSESFWNNLQKQYDETLARLKLEERLKNEKGYTSLFSCYPELVRYGYIAYTKDKKEKTKHLLNFLGITSFTLLKQNYQVAFRKTSKENLSKENLVSWLRCGEIEASKINTKPYDKDKLRTLLPSIKELNLLNAHIYSSELRNILSDCGVAIVYTPYLKNTFVNGASRWLNPEKVLIQLTPRNKKEDILWFTLFHELCHVLKHSKKEGFISFWENNIFNKDFEDLEREADKFATEQLIPLNEWDQFKNTFNNSDKSIYYFASKIGVKPGIVAGRLAKESNNWDRFEKFRISIEVISE